MDFPKMVNVVRRYLWLFVLAVLVASLTTFSVLTSKPTLYEAKTQLLVGPSLDSPSPDLNSLRIGGQLTQTYAEVVNTRPFLESVNSKLDQKTDPESLAEMIETRQNNDTRILTIIVRSQNPQQAAAIANAAAEILIEMSPSKDNTTSLLRTQMSAQSRQLEQFVADTEASIQQLESKLIELGNANVQSPEATQTRFEQQNLIIQQLTEERGRLSEALKTLATVYGVLRDTNTNQLEIVEPAGAVFPVDQNLPLKVAASGAAGLILAMSIIFAIENFDDTIRLPGDFNRVAKVPLLSTISKHKRPSGSGMEQVISFAEPESRATNNYRTVVAKLLFSIGESMPNTLLLSSVGSQSGDDTAEAIANLSVAFAQGGYRVVLVDAQFHNPILTELFEASDRTGLADYLTTNSSKLKLVPINDAPGVHLLPAGLSSKKGSGVVLNSAKIAKLIEELQKEAEIVLVAGSPIPWFAESLTLASHVKNVILVARHGEARSRIVNEVVENLRDMNAHLAGVIFNHNPLRFVSKPNRKYVTGGSTVASEDSQVLKT